MNLSREKPIQNFIVKRWRDTLADIAAAGVDPQDRKQWRLQNAAVRARVGYPHPVVIEGPGAKDHRADFQDVNSEAKRDFGFRADARVRRYQREIFRRANAVGR